MLFLVYNFQFYNENINHQLIINFWLRTILCYNNSSKQNND
jgi:hypothetical protein